MDPSLDIAYAGPAAAGWVTAERMARRAPRRGRRAGPRRSSRAQAGRWPALIHDETLVEQRAFIEAVGAYALVWDENERLAARVDSSRGELRASRARILAAADDERRRIERDLHDGGQQRLVALRIRLQLAEEMMAASPAGARDMLHRLADDVDGVLEELRALAAGVFPAMLAAHGLAGGRAGRRDAVAAAGERRRQGRPAPLHRGGDRRVLLLLEALQNVAKHAEGATGARVLLELDGDLVFEVSDDGAGFDPASTGTRGLMNMRDRVAALAGDLDVRSFPGVRDPGPRAATRAQRSLPEPPEQRRPELLLADEHRGA